MIIYLLFMSTFFILYCFFLYFVRVKVMDKNASTGMAMVLICLLLGNVFFDLPQLNLAAIGFLVVTMTAPRLFTPLATVWYGFSHGLGLIMSRLILTLIFIVLVCPVSCIRRLINPNCLQLKQFKKGNDSLFIFRQKCYALADFNHQF